MPPSLDISSLTFRRSSEINVAAITRDAFVTRSAVRRFCNRLGYQSLSDLKESFTQSVLLLFYSASTAYHTIPAGHPYEETLKKLDHMMIFVLIAGSYTPVCLLAIPGMTGYILLAVVWIIALLGMGFKYFWVYCPKWISSVLYIALGWACVFAFPQLLNTLSTGCFLMASCRRSYLHCRRCHLCTKIVCF